MNEFLRIWKNYFLIKKTLLNLFKIENQSYYKVHNIKVRKCNLHLKKYYIVTKKHIIIEIVAESWIIYINKINFLAIQDRKSILL